MARPKDQTARREHLIQATLRTIANHGLTGVTMASVAAEAGISPRLVAYYYSDLDDLVAATHQVATERYYGARRRSIEDDTTPSVKLAQLMHSGLPRGEDRLLSQVLDEISVNALRSPMHSTLMTLLFEREVSLYVSVLQAGVAAGEFEISEPIELVARNFVALEDALGMHLLGNNTAMDLPRAEAQLASYARTATGAEVVPDGAGPSN
jgi:DNA-binding transcriptional regulator YbjK